MILLTGASDIVQLVTSAAVTTHIHASWVDLNAGVVTPGRLNTIVSTATTTTIVGSPGGSVYRTVKTLHVRNTHATTAQTVTVRHSDGTDIVELIQVTLQAGEVLHYDEGAGFEVFDSQGRSKQNSQAGGSQAAVNSLNLAVLIADVTNNNATPNTIADITGLSFPVTAGETYFFRFTIQYTSAAGTTGARFSVSGPGSPTALRFKSEYSLTATSNTLNEGLSAYDTPAAANVTSAATGANIAIIEGFITPSANGTLIARFASEIASSAIIARAGSVVEWIRVL